VTSVQFTLALIPDDDPVHTWAEALPSEVKWAAPDKTGLVMIGRAEFTPAEGCVSCIYAIGI
jgi:hypothetical protein